MSRTSSAIGIRGWAVSGALALAVTFIASPAHSQVVDKPDANLPAVQDADLGPDARPPYGGRIEVQLAPRAQDALAEGGGWEALDEGVSIRWAGASAEGSAGLEADVHVALVNRDGKVLKEGRLERVRMEPGDTQGGVGGLAALGAEWRVPEPPAAGYSPNETYHPEPDQWAPARELLPSRDWDARHTVTDPDNMDRERAGEDSGEEWKSRGPGVFDDGGDRAGIPVPNITRADERGIGTDDPGQFLLVTVVPTDPDARGQVEVRPLIIDLDGPTGRE